MPVENLSKTVETKIPPLQVVPKTGVRLVSVIILPGSGLEVFEPGWLFLIEEPAPRKTIGTCLTRSCVSVHSLWNYFRLV
jgi:hypothetical protein